MSAPLSALDWQHEAMPKQPHTNDVPEQRLPCLPLSLHGGEIIFQVPDDLRDVMSIQTSFLMQHLLGLHDFSLSPCMQHTSSQHLRPICHAEQLHPRIMLSRSLSIDRDQIN
jgi:hypothetical protein